MTSHVTCILGLTCVVLCIYACLRQYSLRLVISDSNFILCFLCLKCELEEEAMKPAGERTSEPDIVVDVKNQSIVQTIHIDNRVSFAFCIY